MDLPKFHPNERVDLGDIEFLTTGQLGEFQRLQTNLIVGEATKRVLDGFGVSIVSPTVMSIAFGKAVSVENRQAELRYGQLVGGGSPVEGVASQNVSFSGGAAAYSVFVRFVFGDGTIANRAFWDTPTALEEVQVVPTRQVAGWQSVVTLTANDPGADWLRIADVAWDGSSLNTSTITDVRVFLFEGPANSSPQTFRPTWGGGSDRNAARATNGVKTIERFASAVLKKIEEIQSDTAATRWWDAPAEPLSKKVSRFGDLTLAGAYKITGTLEVDGGDITSENILPDADGTRAIGAPFFRYAEAYLRRWDVFGIAPVMDVEITSALIGGKIHFFGSAAEATKFLDVQYTPNDGSASYNVGPGGTSGGEHVFRRNGSALATIKDGAAGGFTLADGIPAHLQEIVHLGEGARSSFVDAAIERMIAYSHGTNFSNAPLRFGYTKLMAFDSAGTDFTGVSTTALYVDSAGGLVAASNAAWNPATGQWTQPAGGSESLLLRIVGGAFTLQKRNAGSAAWNDEDWGGGLAGLRVTADSAHKPDLVSVGSADFSGHVAGGVPPAAPQRGALYDKNAIQGWALIHVTAGVPAVVEGFNVTGIAVDGNNNLVITWDTDMIAGKYVAVASEIINPAGLDIAIPHSYATRVSVAGTTVIAGYAIPTAAAVDFSIASLWLSVIATGAKV